MRPSIVCNCLSFTLVNMSNAICRLSVFLSFFFSFTRNLHVEKWKCCQHIIYYLQSGQFVEIKFMATILTDRSLVTTHANCFQTYIYAVQTRRVPKILANCLRLHLTNTNLVNKHTFSAQGNLKICSCVKSKY